MDKSQGPLLVTNRNMKKQVLVPKWGVGLACSVERVGSYEQGQQQMAQSPIETLYQVEGLSMARPIEPKKNLGCLVRNILID